jgi:hypothetical protein
MRDLGHVPALKSRGRKLVLTCHALAFAPAIVDAPIRRPACNLIKAHLTLERVRQSHNHHPVVKQRRMETQDGGLLARA